MYDDLGNVWCLAELARIVLDDVGTKSRGERRQEEHEREEGFIHCSTLHVNLQIGMSAACNESLMKTVLNIKLSGSLFFADHDLIPAHDCIAPGVSDPKTNPATGDNPVC